MGWGKEGKGRGGKEGEERKGVGVKEGEMDPSCLLG